MPKSHALDKALKPREVVAQLDKFIVGQQEAKKAVAIALRNRWRRHQMSDEMRNEVMQRRILVSLKMKRSSQQATCASPTAPKVMTVYFRTGKTPTMHDLNLYQDPIMDQASNSLSPSHV